MSCNCDEEFNVADCKKKSELKESDFSIDHILNRAGKSCTNVENCSPCPEITQDVISLDKPQFGWLQFTRYNPPKITRQFAVYPLAKRKAGRLPRIPFTIHQLSTLEETFKIGTYISSEDAAKLARRLNLTSTRVKIWFQNRRARDRREQKLNQQLHITSM